MGGIVKQNYYRNAGKIIAISTMAALLMALILSGCGGEKTEVVLLVEKASQAKASQEATKQIEAQLNDICRGEGDKVGSVSMCLCRPVSNQPPTFLCKSNVTCKKGLNPNYVPPPMPDLSAEKYNIF
jgi:hypothetical protein